MAVSKSPSRRAPRTRLSSSEKRRIVELTLCEGASVRAIAREQGVNRNSLYQWISQYRAGKLGAPTARARSGASGATFLPVAIAPAAPLSRSVRSTPRAAGVVEVTFPSGALLRLETDALGVDLVGALLAGLR